MPIQFNKIKDIPSVKDFIQQEEDRLYPEKRIDEQKKDRFHFPLTNNFSGTYTSCITGTINE